MKYFVSTIVAQEMVGDKEKSVKHVYLHKSMSYTETEAQAATIIQERHKPVTTNLDKIVKKEFDELVLLNDVQPCEFFEGKVKMVVYDDKSDTEKEKVVSILIEAYDFQGAFSKLEDITGQSHGATMVGLAWIDYKDVVISGRENIAELIDTLEMDRI